MPNLIESLPSSLPSSLPNEVHQMLAAGDGVRIERIVSNGHATAADSWYDQDRAEWVMVVQGEAKIQFDDDPEMTHLKAGDWINIVPHRRHRVDWTSPDQPTIWLAIYYKP